jgi:hypothetical protein
MALKTLLSPSATASSVKRIAATKKANFKRGISSKKNFKEYLRTPGSMEGSEDGSKWSWTNEGTRFFLSTQR